MTEYTQTFQLDPILYLKLKETYGDNLSDLISRLLKSHALKLLKGLSTQRGRPPIPVAVKIQTLKDQLDKAYANVRLHLGEYLETMPWPWQLEEQQSKIKEMVLNEDVLGLQRILRARPWMKEMVRASWARAVKDSPK
jgi:hypothetical protein